jgi:hypothetical protein
MSSAFWSGSRRLERFLVIFRHCERILVDRIAFGRSKDPRWTADATGVELIIPVASLATGSDLDQPDDGTPDPPMSAEQRARYRGGLEDCVRAIDLYWGARRPPPATPVTRTAPKVGRNDLCPCGSGKKYKRCHGTVH